MAAETKKEIGLQHTLIARLISLQKPAGKRGRVGRGISLFAVLLLGSLSALYSQSLRIVVAGDGRAEFPDRDNPCHSSGLSSVRPEDRNGLNKVIIREIRAAAQREHAQILLWTGDIVNVNDTAGPNSDDKTKFLENGLNEWCNIMRPLYQRGVKVLPTRGNHEVIWYNQDFNPNEISDAARIWTEVFSGPNRLRATGFDQRHLSFYYATGSVLLIGLDQYERTYNDHSVNQDWLNQVLEKNRKPFIFAFGHEPAFATGGRHGPGECLAANFKSRDEMWKALSDAGAQVYLCGHDHFYDRMKIAATAGGYEMQQFTAGTAGAPFYSQGKVPDVPDDQGWKLEHQRHLDSMYGYILIKVEGNTATIQFKGRTLASGQYETKDCFSYTVGSP